MDAPEFDPTYSENGDFVYGGLTAMVVTRVRLLFHRLDEDKSAAGLLAGLFALRVLAEGAPIAARDSIATSEVEDWQERLLAWLEKSKPPKGVSREAMIERAKHELAVLKRISFPTPRSIWQSHLQLDLAEAAKRREAKKSQ